jgi:hypothetical protein
MYPVSYLSQLILNSCSGWWLTEKSGSQGAPGPHEIVKSSCLEGWVLAWLRHQMHRGQLRQVYLQE